MFLPHAPNVLHLNLRTLESSSINIHHSLIKTHSIDSPTSSIMGIKRKPLPFQYILQPLAPNTPERYHDPKQKHAQKQEEISANIGIMKFMRKQGRIAINRARRQSLSQVKNIHPEHPKLFVLATIVVLAANAISLLNRLHAAKLYLPSAHCIPLQPLSIPLG